MGKSAGRPRLYGKRKITVTLSDDNIVSLDELAKKLDITRGEVLDSILTNVRNILGKPLT